METSTLLYFARRSVKLARRCGGPVPQLETVVVENYAGCSCYECGGDPALADCTFCGGHATLHTREFLAAELPAVVERACEVCSGSGWVAPWEMDSDHVEKCPACGGRGKLR